MKKRVLTLALALTLVVGCAVFPASAAGTAADELTQVTLAVKGQLGLGDEYETFSSDCADLGVLRYWQLRWSNEDGASLEVTADSTGKILSYNRFDPQAEQAVASWESSGFTPSFPAVNAQQVTAAANAFLAKVISDPESAKVAPVELSLTGYRRSVSVRGEILLNGVDSPMSWRMYLSLPELTVTSFYRQDAWGTVVLGDVPSASPAVGVSAAHASLNSVLKMELRYVQTEDGSIALRYVPVTQGDWYADAQTGELVDMSKLPGSSRLLGTSNGAGVQEADAGEAAPAPSGAPTLSEAEQATVDQMAGTLSAAQLDELLKKITPLGLSKMTQAGASYYMDKEGGITCRLTYTRPLEQGEIAERYTPEEFGDQQPALRKYITVDAMTGALKQVYSDSDFANENAFQGDASAVVKDFLSAQYPSYFAACVRKDADTDAGHYVRQVNGVPYYGHYFRADVCGVDGTIGSFSMDWDEDTQFPAPENIVTEQAALDAYAGCYEARLRYIAYPEKVDANDAQWLTYVQQLGDVKYSWVLAYALDGDEPQGIDAFTGEVAAWPGKTDRALAYTDVANSYGKAEIEALAEYGVGFSRGDTFRPAAQVNQRDMLVLLLSAVGHTFDADNMDAETEDALYDSAYRQGLLTKGQRDPDRAVTRIEFLRTMLVASAYGKAAQITGIFKTSFTDADAIAAADLGYAAIGQGLGIVAGNERGELRPNATLTRQDAAIMLCRLMNH